MHLSSTGLVRMKRAFLKIPGRITVSAVCHRPGVDPMSVMWDLSWTQQHWDRFKCNYFGFNLSLIMLHTENSFSYHRRYVILAPDSPVKRNISQFYVLLTVHLGIILVNDQLDAQFLFLYVSFNSVHVSSNLVLTLTRIVCISTATGMCQSV
jgi:hypothetical protein